MAALSEHARACRADSTSSSSDDRNRLSHIACFNQAVTVASASDQPRDIVVESKEKQTSD
jgi:hypothetical protein